MQAISGVIAWSMLNPFVEEVLKKGKLEDAPVIFRNFLLFTFLTSLAMFVHHYLSHLMGNLTGKELHQVLFEKLQRLPLQYFKKEKGGEWLSRVTLDLESFIDFFRAPVQDLVVNPTIILISLTASLLINWKITLLTAFVFPILGLALARLADRLRRATRRTRVHLASLVSAYQENISHTALVRLYGLEKFSREQFAQKNWLAFRAKMKEALIRAGETPLAQMTGGLALAVVMYVAMKEIAGNPVSLGNFGEGALISQLFILIQQVIRPLRGLNRAVLQWQTAVVLGARIQEVLQLPEPSRTHKGTFSMPLRSPTITWNEVWFSYGEGAPWALKGATLTAPGGKILAIVGPSGAGKTTLINLLLQFYPLQQGSIYINDTSLLDWSVPEFHAQIGVVPQESPLFHTSIAENIRLGKLDATVEEIVEAAKKANAHPFIMKLPGGYDADVGERGEMLSGGQKQRISIARALLRQPAILILDEAVAELDAQTEAEILKEITESLPHCTKILIAHRLSTAAKADVIAVLEDGKVVQYGTHNELLQQDALYRRLWNLQMVSAELEEKA